MRLYYFTSEKFGLEAIRDKRLKIARINELNDPFEFLGIKLNLDEIERPERRAIKNVKDQMNKNRGLICMSKNWQNPLLWGHYADKYKGLALGFDILKEGIFEKVSYKKKRLSLRELGVETLKEFTNEHMKELLHVKYWDWKYEAEYRAFCGLEKEDPVSGLYFKPFMPEMQLKEVILGMRCDISRSRLDKVLGNGAPEVKKFKSRAGFENYEVVENQLDRAWKD